MDMKEKICVSRYHENINLIATHDYTNFLDVMEDPCSEDSWKGLVGSFTSHICVHFLKYIRQIASILIHI